MRRTSPTTLLFCLIALFIASTSAASAAVQNRITAAVSGTARKVIPDSVHGKARFASDLGVTPGDTKLEAMTLRFSLTDAQQAALDQLLSDQQNPASTRYHQWLTPAQYGAQFGLSSADIVKVSAWLTGQGFTITEIPDSNTFIRFNGTVAQAQTAFSTSIDNLSLNGEVHFANTTDASVPAALSGVVAAVTGLHNFRLKSRVRTSVATAPLLRPQFTSSISGSHYVAPGDFYSIYNESPLFAAAINGAGVSIAVMGQVDINLSDIAAFRAAAGLTANVPTIKLYGTDPGAPKCTTNACSPNSGDLAESSLDVEWAGATAPSAAIIFVNSTDVVGLSLTNAINANLAPIMSISYGDCEAGWGTSYMNTLNQLLKQANAQGITVTAPAGDAGATDCESGVTTATQGLAVDFPGSSPYATSMGGTMFTEGSTTGATAYWNSNSTSSTSNAGSAISYIPEGVWNEDVTGSTFSAGGGGVSNFFTKPAWQKGTGVPADASRDVPDLALDSAASHDGYLYCASSSCVTGFRASDGQSLTVAGGTSFAAPAFAGILALVEQKTGSRIGNANQTIYALANTTAYYNATSTSAFHDVTTGNNNNPCTTGSTNCPNGGTIGYSAGTGYDLATGWGSVNAYNLVNAWNLVTPLGVGTTGASISTTTLTASPTAVAAGATITLTATVTGAAATPPTGTVQFLVGNTATGSPITLSGGTATLPFVSSCSTLGKLIFAASYSGDANYAGSKSAGITSTGFTTSTSTVSPIAVTVTSGTCPDFSISAPTPPTVTAGTPSVVITVAPINGFTGTVVFSATATETSSVVPIFSFSPSAVTINSASATSTLTLSNVTGDLHLPLLPGKLDSGTQLAQREPSHRIPWYVTGSGATLASLLFLVLPRRRRLGGLLVAVVSLLLIGGATGCSSTKNSVIVATSNPSVGTYTVNVVGTYTSSASVVTTHTTTVTFVVQ